jgi:hypothetical protein
VKVAWVKACCERRPEMVGRRWMEMDPVGVVRREWTDWWMGVKKSAAGAKVGREVMRRKAAEALRRRREGEDGHESGVER